MSNTIQTSESTTDTILRYAANLAIMAGFYWLFHELDWITFTAEKPLLTVLVLSALLSWIVGVIVDKIYLTFILVTCFLGCLTLPIKFFIAGYIEIYIVSALTGWFTINVNFFFYGLIMSLAVSLITVHEKGTFSKLSRTSSD